MLYLCERKPTLGAASLAPFSSMWLGNNGFYGSCNLTSAQKWAGKVTCTDSRFVLSEYCSKLPSGLAFTGLVYECTGKEYGTNPHHTTTEKVQEDVTHGSVSHRHKLDIIP